MLNGLSVTARRPGYGRQRHTRYWWSSRCHSRHRISIVTLRDESSCTLLGAWAKLRKLDRRQTAPSRVP
eukprot:scaffold2349_cov407-Prasinococcus_capsulatus_cf.AAC.7